MNPAFSYKGSVLSDLIHTSLRTSETSPVLGTGLIEMPPSPPKEFVIGGQDLVRVKRVAFRKRTKGLICDTCASCTSTVEGKNGERVPVVITEARGGFLGETSHHEEGGPRAKPKGFNTRVTQGRRGRRI